MRNMVKFTAASVAVAMMIGIAGCGSPNSSNGGAATRMGLGTDRQ